MRLLLAALLAAGGYTATTVTSRLDLPPFWDEVPIDLYYIEAPMPNAGDFTESLAQAAKYHSGLAFQTKRSSDLYVMEFKTNDIVNSVLPKIVMDDTGPYGAKTLKWENQAEIEFARIHPTSYWDLGNKVHLATISGAIWNKFLCYVPSYEANYQLFNVYDNRAHTKQYVSSSTGDDFIWAMFRKLADLGVKMEMDAIPRKRWNLYTANTEPKLVDFNSPSKRSNIIAYYQNIEELKVIMEEQGVEPETSVPQLLFQADYDRAYVPAGGSMYWELYLADPIATFTNKLTGVESTDASLVTTLQMEDIGACIPPQSPAEFWMWKMAAFTSFFMGTFFLYKAYHGYIKHGPIRTAGTARSKRAQKGINEAIFSGTTDPYVALTLSMMGSGSAPKRSAPSRPLR